MNDTINNSVYRLQVGICRYKNKTILILPVSVITSCQPTQHEPKYRTAEQVMSA